MKKIAEFKKVSFEKYLEEMKKNFDLNEEVIKEYYNHIDLPKRATIGSAGYDFTNR